MRRRMRVDESRQGLRSVPVISLSESRTNQDMGMLDVEVESDQSRTGMTTD